MIAQTIVLAALAASTAAFVTMAIYEERIRKMEKKHAAYKASLKPINMSVTPNMPHGYTDIVASATKAAAALREMHKVDEFRTQCRMLGLDLEQVDKAHHAMRRLCITSFRDTDESMAAVLDVIKWHGPEKYETILRNRGWLK